MNYDIFISYRRDGGFGTAKHLNDLLVHDGYTVSFDIDTLREGDFDETLLQRIDQCVDFILMVDKHTFDRTLDPNFDPKKDWLRLELAYALKLKKNIIPILLSGVDGFPDNLPEDIADVATKNGLEYSKYYFDEFYRRLKSFLHCISRNDKSNVFRKCPNGHYYQGDHCPFCKSAEPRADRPTRSPHTHIECGGYGGSVESRTVRPTSSTHTEFEGYGESPAVYMSNDGKKVQRFFRKGRRPVGRLVSSPIDSLSVEFELYEGRNVIGRGAECDIKVEDNMVSTRHATVLYRAGRFTITDCQSSHGTYVNNNDIELEPCWLKDGDIIKIGETEFEFKNDYLIQNDQQVVYSSIFAPAEVKRKSHLLVQLFIHHYDEAEDVIGLAKESDSRTERRGSVQLPCKLKKGDMVDVLLNIYGETLLMSEKKSIFWKGSFTKLSFDYFVPKDIDVEDLSCLVLLTVNDMPVGEMSFITKIVESPRELNTEIVAHKYNRVFISYAHEDEEKVRSFHEALDLTDIDHFFDRAYLKTGDVFPQVIQDYINSADLFVLFWSENASKSEYVQKERKQALERAFPQVKPRQAAKLSIYPMSIEPRAELPSDMKNNYHFGEV